MMSVISTQAPFYYVRHLLPVVLSMDCSDQREQWAVIHKTVSCVRVRCLIRTGNMILKHRVMLCGLSLLSVGLLAGICVPVGMSVHQEQLDHALIAAIKNQDAEQTIALLDQ